MENPEPVPSRLYRWVKQFQPVPKRLLWTHVTDGWALREVVENGQFEPRLCPVFQQNLFYLFYGRPAYRKKLEEAMRTSAKAPVIFLFGAAVEKLAVNLHPFDSGAFQGKLYQTWVHRHMPLPHFALPCDGMCPPNYVKAFFETNDDYWYCRATTQPRNFAGDHEVEALFDMMLDRDIKTADDRRLVLELIVGQPVPLTSEYVKAIIVPHTLMDALYMEDIPTRLQIPVSPYIFQCNRPAIEYQVLLELQVREILNAMDVFL